MNFLYKTSWAMLFASAITVMSCSSEIKGPSGIEHVIVIGVDGLSPDGIQKASTPVMDSLINNGAVKWNSRTVLTSASSQNWSSMIMGTGPEIHGITDNDWELDNHTLSPVIQTEDGRFPTIFSILKAQRPDVEIGVIHHWSGFGRLYAREAVSYEKRYTTEDSTTVAFAEYIRSKKPVLGFVHLDHVDHAGHHHGHGTPHYYESITKTDSLVGQIVTAIKEAGIADKTLIMIVSDHGGIGHGHGGYTLAETEVPVILSGAGVKNGYKVLHQTAVYDYAPTIAFALGVKPIYEWTGRPIKAAFTGFSEPENSWKGFQLIDSPKMLPYDSANNRPGGVIIDKDASVTILSDKTDNTIRYTLDGTPPTSESTIYSGPITLTKTSIVKAKAFDKNGSSSNILTGYYRLAKSSSKQGVTSTYYAMKPADKLPDFKSLKKGGNWVDYEFDLNKSKITPLLAEGVESFGLVSEGFIQIDQPGNYNFYCSSDDGSKLYINGKLIIDNDGSHAVVEKSGSIELETGLHPIRVDYFNDSGGLSLEVFYKGPNLPRQPIPADKLFTSK